MPIERGEAAHEPGEDDERGVHGEREPREREKGARRDGDQDERQKKPEVVAPERPQAQGKGEEDKGEVEDIEPGARVEESRGLKVRFQDSWTEATSLQVSDCAAT